MVEIPNGRSFALPAVPAAIEDVETRRYLEDLKKSIESQFGKEFDNVDAVRAGINVGTSAGQIVALDGSAKLPTVDGSQLLNLPATTLKTYINVASRVLNATDTTVAFVVGFQPSLVILEGAVKGGTEIPRSTCYFNSATGQGFYCQYGTGKHYSNNTFILYEATNVGQFAAVNTFNSTGFTLDWTRAGSPSGDTAFYTYTVIGT